MASSELTQRVLVALAGVPAVLVLIYLGGWPLGILLAFGAALGAREVYNLASARGARAFVPEGMALAAAFVVVGAAVPDAGAAAGPFWVLVLVMTLALLAWSIWSRGTAGQPLAGVAITIFGATVTGGTLVYALFLRHLPDAAALPWLGAALVAYPVAITWIGDTAAYFAGRAWGRRKLHVTVSPAKTVEGAVGGLVAASVTGALFAALIFQLWLGVPIGAIPGALGGVLISVVAQVGDLAESLLKREAGVKDSGKLLPGHGGVLDRLDALFFALPTAYLYLGVLLPRTIEGLPWR